jgi:hypothetical protein
MLVIREAQLEALGRAMASRFEKQMLRRLEQMRREQLIALPGEELPGHIVRGVREAANYGLRSEAHLARYISLACRFLGGFGGKAHPKEAVSILKAYGVSVEARLERLEQWCRETGGRSAARR